MSKTHIFERWDVDADGYRWQEFDGEWVKAEDAINREAGQAVHIRTLEVQLRDAKAETQRLHDLIANPQLLGMNVAGSSLEIELKGAGPMLFAQSFSDYFRESGATNYIEMRLTSPDPEIGELVCTLQRVNGETPTQQLNDARRTVAEFLPVVKFAGLMLVAHRNDGYPGDVDGDVIQNAALACGLIASKTVNERCGENCSCAEFVGADEWGLNGGIQCYFDTHLAQIAKDAAK
jgi:hypothetical protein